MLGKRAPLPRVWDIGWGVDTCKIVSMNFCISNMILYDI
jgi:hypothetical protein